ncbi:MAG: phosphate signaling complex protein PhoU [Clostridia bacterium]
MFRKDAREFFVKDLNNLFKRVLYMGDLVEHAIKDAIKALETREVALAHLVIEREDLIDREQEEIENACISLIAMQQPVAKDLRLISAILKVITDLERMGDYAEDIAEIVIKFADQPLMKPLIDIPLMAETTIVMVNKALDAFVREDVELAKEMCEMDSIVDKLYSQVKQDVIKLMEQDTKHVEQGVYLIFIARYLERIADHTTNVGEDIIYLVTGKRESLN